MKDLFLKTGKKLISHELISGSFYVFIGGMIANGFAFLLNLFLARSLSYSDYAIFASLLSVITLASIPAGSINTVIVKFATNLFVKNENDRLKTLYMLFFKFVLGLSIFIIFLFAIFSVPLMNYLHMDNVWYVIITGFVISSFYLSTLNGAFLQSLLKFKFISLLNILGSSIKLIVGVLLVFLGYRAFGGLGAIFSMTFGMFLIAYLPLVKILKQKSSNKSIALNTKQMLTYAVPTFITVLFLTSFTSMDVILVKHFFNSHDAGFYAGLSLIGKVIFYFTAPIPMVMFPLLVKRHATGVNFNNLFYLALLLVVLPSVAITAFYFVFPNFVINLFLGGREYLSVAKYLGIFGVYLTVFSLVNVCVSFFLSLNKTNVSALVVFAAITQIILIYIFHTNFYQIIGVSMLISVSLFIALLFIFFKNYGNTKHLKETITFLNTTGV
ncbi:MAG TPA: oligosaccharide flippase family protein [Patescibacteria group bacterium]|jgi:O-antigen/teichoic acid export membrane protein|nr:oligosaccharide flippase family protein [Patescibacteria group bacterium]